MYRTNLATFGIIAEEQKLTFHAYGKYHCIGLILLLLSLLIARRHSCDIAGGRVDLNPCCKGAANYAAALLAAFILDTKGSNMRWLIDPPAPGDVKVCLVAQGCARRQLDSQSEEPVVERLQMERAITIKIQHRYYRASRQLLRRSKQPHQQGWPQEVLAIVMI